MDLRSRLNTDLRNAIREKKPIATSTIRLILAAVKEKDIQARTKGIHETASEQEILSLLQSMIKQREESTRTYENAGRTDLAMREQDEIAIIKNFLPEQIDEAELEVIVAGIIHETGISSIKDMGQVMNELKSRYAGQIDMGRASALVKQKLMAKN